MNGENSIHYNVESIQSVVEFAYSLIFDIKINRFYNTPNVFFFFRLNLSSLDWVHFVCTSIYWFGLMPSCFVDYVVYVYTRPNVDVDIHLSSTNNTKHQAYTSSNINRKKRNERAVVVTERSVFI